MYFHTAFFATIAFILALRVSAAPLPIEVQVWELALLL